MLVRECASVKNKDSNDFQSTQVQQLLSYARRTLDMNVYGPKIEG